MNEVTLLTAKEVQKKTRLSVVSIWKLSVNGLFPLPMRPFGATGKKLYLEADIDQWIIEQFNNKADVA